MRVGWILRSVKALPRSFIRRLKACSIETVPNIAADNVKELGENKGIGNTHINIVCQVDDMEFNVYTYTEVRYFKLHTSCI